MNKLRKYVHALARMGWASGMAGVQVWLAGVGARHGRQESGCAHECGWQAV